MTFKLVLAAALLVCGYCWNPSWVIDYTATNLGNQTASTKMLIVINRIPSNWDKVNQFLGAIQHKLQIPTFVISQRVDFQINTIADKDSFTLVFLEYHDEETFEIARLLLMKMHFCPFLVVIIVKQRNLNFLHLLFDYMWRHGFVLPIVYFQDEFGADHVYLHFLNNTLTDVTGIVWRDLPGGHRFDLYKQTIVTPIRFDPPRVFIDRNGNLDGSIGKLFLLFANYLNATIENYPMPRSSNALNMKDLLRLLKNHKIDITIHSYAAFDKMEIGESYPLEIVKWCLMVPVNYEDHGNEHKFITQPFKTLSWLLIFVTVVFVCLVDIAFFIRVPIKLGSCIIYVARMLTNSNFQKLSEKHILSRFILCSVAFMFSFFTTLIYTSVIGSILIVSTGIHQIDSQEDLIASKLKIMAIDFEIDFLFKYQDFSKDFKELFIRVSSETFMQHRNSFNTSFAYPVTEDRWFYAEVQQKNMNKKIFRFSKICFGNYQMGFPMQSDSPLTRDLETFIHIAYASGLIDYFKTIAFDKAVLEGYLKRINDLKFDTPISFSHLRYIFLSMIIIYALSVVLFLGEFKYHEAIFQKIRYLILKCIK